MHPYSAMEVGKYSFPSLSVILHLSIIVDIPLRSLRKKIFLLVHLLMVVQLQIEILLGKTENFDNLMAAAAEEEAEDGEEQI